MSRFSDSQRASQDRLWERYWADENDQDAFEALVITYQGFVSWLAHQQTPMGETQDDYEQVANIGLIKAIRRFKPNAFNAKFTTYAALTIVGELKRHHRDKGWHVHVPRQLKELHLKLRKLEDQFCSEYGRTPANDQELADYCQCPLDLIEELRRFQHEMRIMYLDTPIVSEESGTEGRVGDYELHDQDGSLRSADHLDLLNAINALPERERGIVFARFFKEQTQNEIAQAFGISQMHVSRLLAKTLIILRQQLTAEGDEILLVQATQTAVIRRSKPAYVQAAFGKTVDAPATRPMVSRPSPPPPQIPAPKEEQRMSPTQTTTYDPVICQQNAFIIAALLWWKVSAQATHSEVDYGSLYREAGLEKPEPYIISNAIARLKNENVIISTGRCAFRRGPASKIKFAGESIEPFPKLLSGFKVRSGDVFDLKELAEQIGRRGAPAPAPPKPALPPAPEQETPRVEAGQSFEPMSPPTPSTNGKAHHLPELDYTSLALRAKAEGLRAQAAELIRKAETLEEAAHMKEIFAQANEIMES